MLTPIEMSVFFQVTNTDYLIKDSANDFWNMGKRRRSENINKANVGRERQEQMFLKCPRFLMTYPLIMIVCNSIWWIAVCVLFITVLVICTDTLLMLVRDTKNAKQSDVTGDDRGGSFGAQQGRASLNKWYFKRNLNDEEGESSKNTQERTFQAEGITNQRFWRWDLCLWNRMWIRVDKISWWVFSLVT